MAEGKLQEAGCAKAAIHAQRLSTAFRDQRETIAPGTLPPTLSQDAISLPMQSVTSEPSRMCRK